MCSLLKLLGWLLLGDTPTAADLNATSGAFADNVLGNTALPSYFGAQKSIRFALYVPVYERGVTSRAGRFVRSRMPVRHEISRECWSFGRKSDPTRSVQTV
jgi:hypothetical protein